LQKLFRLTTKRLILLESILTTINGRKEFMEDLLEHPYEKERNERTVKMKQELAKIQLAESVLVTVSYHNSNLKDLNYPNNPKKHWRNEWDIPLEEFTQGIKQAIELLRWYQEITLPEFREKKEKQIEFLQLLEEFRKAG